MAVSRIVLLVVLRTMVSGQFCPALHANFLRRQAAEPFKSTVPFNETKGAKHTPYITINGAKGTVKVGNGSPYHPMVASNSPGTVHYITHIYILDQNDGFVAMSRLDPTGVSMAQMDFDIPSGATKLVAYEWCNLHGLWKGPEVSVSGGSKTSSCTKPPVASAAQVSIIADLHRRQAASPFNSASPFTEANGKKHTPYIALNAAKTTGTVTVGDGSPYHPMVGSTDAATVHFITLIYVLNQDGNVVVMENLDPTGVDKASITFSVPSGATRLTAYEWCNLHGLWKGPTVNTTTPNQVTSNGAWSGMRLGACVVFAVAARVANLL